MLHVKPGDTVLCEVQEFSGQLTRNSKVEDYLALRSPGHASKLFPLAGPIYVEGASEGDTLVVHILEMKVSDWGWSGLRPNYFVYGPEEIGDPWFYIWDLSNGKYAPFKNGIKVPIRPFPGTIGVCPKEPGDFDSHSAFEASGGNMDIHYLAKGSRLMLPVHNEGALFSVGDPHAAQGDGELSTALESPAEITVRLELEKGKRIPSPQYFSSDEKRPADSYFATTGSAPDLMEAVKLAARHMIDYLMEEHGLERHEAFVVCGVAGDLRIHQLVNPPNWTVGLMIPHKVLTGEVEGMIPSRPRAFPPTRSDDRPRRDGIL